MSSNMLAGERRWASARRGGMTVLGKVAVPKPLNLPSQRLENHGLDPNVEIVPKGTLSWGSRPSSSGSNAWVSSSSPNADGGTVSPSHLSGRPSSGGSGTRPSTAGSDRTQEPVGNAWGSNSRPSSASGTLSSSQTSSAILRPRSAENRPNNSSQLSRFAEPGFKSSVAWGPSGTAERLGVKPFKDDGFSLSSGDFPTLGSEKDNSAKNIDSGDNGRPSSASGRMAHIQEDPKLQSDTRHGAVNTWRPDGTRSAEDDIHPGMEKWSGEHHQYINANAGPQHFDAWHGPPANGPAGVWYGGRPRGPAFGGPVPPGGFPMEPFPYYHPQMPPPPLAGSQPVPHRGPGPRGPHPKNGDFYRPKVHDSYARPGMPFRPGFYPGPPGPMGFEGFYGPPPMRYCNNERDIPYMGMPSGPPVYNGYAAPRPDIADSHGRLAAHPSGKSPGQMDPDHFEDAQVPKRTHLKKRNEYEDQREEGENQKNIMQSNVSHPGKNRLPMISSRKNEWGAEVDAEDANVSKGAMANETSHSYEYEVRSSENMKMKSFDGTGNAKGDCRNDSEEVSSFTSETLPHASGRELSKPAAAKNSVLMHKIDGLNAKVRDLDGRNDGSNAHYRDEERNRPRMVDSKSNNYSGEVGNTAAHFERIQFPKEHTSRPHELVGPVTDKRMQPVTVVSRRSMHGGQGRVEYRGKGKFSQDPDGWNRKPPPNTESSCVVVVSSNEFSASINERDPDIGVDSSESSLINSTGRLEGDSDETHDSADSQRTKMRELAKQRAMQLQKEEEERIRDMKAKAFAKLEELNRRTSVGDVANPTTDHPLSAGDILTKQELPSAGEPPLNLVSYLDATAVDNTNWAGENTNLLESNEAPLPVPEDAHDDSAQKETSRYNDGGFSRQKRASYKQRHNNSIPKGINEKSVPSIVSEMQKDHSLVSTGDATSLDDPSFELKQKESNVPSGPMGELQSGQQRKKSSKAGKNKHKVMETPTPAPPPVLPDPIPRKDSFETSESKKSNMDIPVLDTTEQNNGVQGHDVGSSLRSEEPHGNRVSHQWKSNTSRKLPRNQQSNRFTGKQHGNDFVVWAPVPIQNKAKGPVDAGKNSFQESSAYASQNPVSEPANYAKGDSTAQNSSRGKRAEMERYVPKPVAKELAQQGTVPAISSSSTRSSRSNEGPGREQSGSAGLTSPQPASSVAANILSSVENDGTTNHNKPKTDHGMWKQRGSVDISHTTTLQFGDIPASETIQFLKGEIYATTAEPKSSGSFSSSGGENPSFGTMTKYPSGKDQGASSRGKWQPSKGGHRNTGNHPDPDNGSVGEFDGGLVQCAAPVVNQTERPVVLKESRTSPQWQPKAQSNPGNNQRGNKCGSETETTETNRHLKKDHLHRKVQALPHHDNEPAIVTQPCQGHTVNATESVVSNHQEIDKEKRPAPANQRPYSPNPDSSDPAAIANTDDPIERSIPSGSRRNARHNPRFSRGHELRSDWSGGNHHDNRPHNPSYRDRHRQNVHYEYQPVGQPMDRGTADNMDHRPHRGRGQSHLKRGGNYYRRQTSGGNVAAHADSQD